MPGTLIMPSGGVLPEKENLKTWFDSGACCVGMGSSLFSREIISSRNMALLRSRVSDIMELIKDVRNG
jgi:2-dehydro-3-deoxyphosphogluconate aldolase/(4S)-4-hydroxy-2-oxoglutarate aldolase